MQYIMLIVTLSICCYRCGSSPGIADIPERPEIKKAAESSSCRDGTTLTYENFGEAFMVSYCVNCHSSEVEDDDRLGAPENINLDSYENITTHRRSILKTAAQKRNPTMPPSRHISLEERELLSEWLNCGAPGNKSQIE